MSAASEPVPRFRIGDWVTYRYGSRRMLARIIEDRGLLGVRGRRLYRLLVDDRQEEPITTEIPEEELEAASGVRPATAAREAGFSTQNWPRQAFVVRYARTKGTNQWTARLELAFRLGTGTAGGAIGYSTALWESEASGDETSGSVTVFLEYDPRLPEAGRPASHPEIWEAMIREARALADEMFRAKHPKAVIEHDNRRPRG